MLASLLGLAQFKLFELLKQLIDIRYMVEFRRNVLVANRSIGIDEIQRAFREAIRIAHHIVQAGHLSLGMKVRKQGKGETADGRPGPMTVEAVHRDAEQLGVGEFEFCQLGLIEAELIAADGAPVQWIENQDDILPAEV